MQAPVKGLSVHHGRLVDGTVDVRRVRHGDDRRRPPPRRSRARTPRRTWCTRRCASRWATPRRRRARENAPSRIRFDFRSRVGGARRGALARDRGARQRRGCRTTSRSPTQTWRSTRRGRWARWRCSARSTATRCASSRSAATGRASCARARTCSAPASSAWSRCWASRRSAPACAASTRSSATGAYGYQAKERALVGQLSGLLGARPDELPSASSSLLTRLKDSEKELAGAAPGDAARAGRHARGRRARPSGRPACVTHDAGEVGGDDLRTLVLDVRARLGESAPAVVAIGGVSQGPPGRRRRDERGGARAGRARPARSCGRRRASSAAAAAARTTSRRAAAPTRPGSAEALAAVARGGERLTCRDTGPVTHVVRGGAPRRRRRIRPRRARGERPGRADRHAGGDARRAPRARRAGCPPTSREVVREVQERGVGVVYVGLPRHLSGRRRCRIRGRARVRCPTGAGRRTGRRCGWSTSG